ncbi:DNA primase [Plakobranchus ocellatus]|uniref:DNA primase n=1 Tax=Plakobranchus ocellatus TaxID=259542 RepID=A0AAV4CG26_9GAST|nr:DNA primase [Plakobranchus ocellatus]
MKSVRVKEAQMTESGRPHEGDLRLSGPPSGQGAGGGARTRDRKVPADLRAELLATMPPTPRFCKVVKKREENMPADTSYDPNSLPDLLPLYYKRLFPYGPYYRWMNYGGVPKHYFSNREFSFTLKDDVYIRYQSFSDQQDFEKELQKKCPYKIDIGAVYSHRPKDHKTVKSTAFIAQEKELVFDIDMTDYDDVRFCCSGADICSKCWPLMVMAVKILDRALRDDFGFEHLLWVYSGRRGIHCWVCDETARSLSSQGRSAVAEYLQVVKGGENLVRKAALPDKIHPSIRHSLQIIDKYFLEYAVKNQDLLECEDKWNKVINIIPSDNILPLYSVERDYDLL